MKRVARRDLGAEENMAEQIRGSVELCRRDERVSKRRTSQRDEGRKQRENGN